MGVHDVDVKIITYCSLLAIISDRQANFRGKTFLLTENICIDFCAIRRAYLSAMGCSAGFIYPLWAVVQGWLSAMGRSAGFIYPLWAVGQGWLSAMGRNAGFIYPLWAVVQGLFIRYGP